MHNAKEMSDLKNTIAEPRRQFKKTTIARERGNTQTAARRFHRDVTAKLMDKI
jgi:hypothetical protein